MDIHIYLHDSKLEELILQLIKKVEHMDAATQTALDNLNKAVAADTTVEKSVETLLQGLSAQILDLKNQTSDPAVAAAIQQAADIVNANVAAASAAVTANTPAA